MHEDRLITVDIRQGDIDHRISLEAFKDRMIDEVGSVALTMTRKGFRKQVSSAIDRVIQQIRDGR